MPSVDLVMTQTELEEQRQQILRESNEIARTRQELDIIVCEYNIAHGFTPVNNEPSHVGKVRDRGRNINRELARDGKSNTSMSATYVSADKPKYSTLAKNLKAAQAATYELPNLSGEALRKEASPS
jgi:hypothetical protein